MEQKLKYLKFRMKKFIKVDCLGITVLEKFVRKLQPLDKIVIILQTVMFTEKQYWMKIKVHGILYEKVYMLIVSE